ncbi:hypothetical protein HUO13_28585 [Saccharopolyspora erythraea]|uniref:hypothetical protein n=1 Tax=Saccharopolyspora erythraea TaxID=1836 RepID=UPI001BA8A92A|nr:hypothetical protein [Saccharopolyspora erythraea]QUH04222.1 hypothetical protein HUO13_28585 [Saccharopolyspora erythraea]
MTDPAPTPVPSAQSTSSSRGTPDQVPGGLVAELRVISQRLAELGPTMNEIAATLYATGCRDDRLDRAVDAHCCALERLQRLLDSESDRASRTG